MNEHRILEMFSGIGGMHYAFKNSGIRGDIIVAVDINPVANAVYNYNFPNTKVLNNNIQNLNAKQLEEMNLNVVLMSPPCQPFTRVGKQKDLLDARTDAFRYICDNLLPALTTIDYILMENVKGFETSKARELYMQCLQQQGFFIREFITSPTEFGIPNTRTRYYNIARRKHDFNFEQSSSFTFNISGAIKDTLFTIQDILEYNNDEINHYEYFLDKNTLKKRISVLDIVTYDCKNSCCFTKSYTHYNEGTGSVFSYCTQEQIIGILEKIAKYEHSLDSIEYNDELEKLRLRYFTPKEISRLMCFPDDFKFPSNITNKQKYRLLGNSINVVVVSELIKLLFS